MRTRLIGDVEVTAIGLGAMPLSIEGHPDEARALATVHAALDAGVTLLDTADSYHPPGGPAGANEVLVARALAGYGGDRDAVLVATKGGRGRSADGGWTVDGRPRPADPGREPPRDGPRLRRGGGARPDPGGAGGAGGVGRQARTTRAPVPYDGGRPRSGS